MDEIEESAREFLINLTKALSALSLYEQSHPQREKAADACFLAFTDLQANSDQPSFTFLDGEVALDGQPLTSLRGWEWGRKFASIGMERIEILPHASRDDLIGFLDFTIPRLQGLASGVALPETFQFGPVTAGTGGAEFVDGEGTYAYELASPEELSLGAEVELLDGVMDEARTSATIHIAEVTAVVESLVSLMASSQELLLPIIRLKTHDQYTATHSVNVSVLAMALAEYLGLTPDDVRLIGIGGVLHDIGKTRIAKEVLTKPGKLTDEEFDTIRSHPVEGAKMIIESDQSMELAAIMAYEHHIRYDGGGYPSYAFKRSCHVASDLLHVCDVYDALATDRPYRDGWKAKKILGYLEEGSGSEFNPAMVEPFVTMMKDKGTQIKVLQTVDRRIAALVGTGDTE